MLDSAGQITGNSQSASVLSPSGNLVGTAFVSLFAFEVVSTDPEFLEAQWDGVLASALDRPATLTLQPDATGASREVRVRLEKMAGGAGGYLATLQTPPPAAAAPQAGSNSLTQLTEHGALGLFELNLATGRVVLSPAWKKLLGYAASELPDTLAAWRLLVHPDDTGAAPDKVGRKVPAGSRTVNVEYRMKHRLGHWVWIQCVGVQMVESPGKVSRVVGLHLDISERKELEDSLVANDARLNDLSGIGPLAAFELDFAQEYFWFSPAWERLLGHAEGALPTAAASFAGALPPEEASAGVAEWLLTRAPGQNVFVEPVKLRAKDGKAVPVLLGVHRSVSRKRELLRVVGFACPLPAEAAAASGALPTSLSDEAFNALAEGVLITDARGKILLANATALRLLRAPSGGLGGQALGDVFRLRNRQSGRPADDPIDAALAADKPLSLISTDALAPAADGEKPTPVVWTARAIYGANSVVQGAVVVFRDPEEMTLTWDELVRANRFEQLGLLAGGIAHDFNNHLTTILGAVSLAQKGRDYSRLDDAEQSCMAAKGLTKQLLAFAKGGAGTQVVCTPKEILHDAFKVAASASAVAEEIEVAEGTENVLVDRGQILQVFQNLIVNAVQAMPPAPHPPRILLSAGNITLADNQAPGLAGGDYVFFEVRDNGAGIKPEHQEKIFDPFFTTKKHGTGLGLATVLSIVRKHKGEIALNSVVGEGTVFTVYLPKAEQPVEERSRPMPSLPYGTDRVLFMDDDPKISALTATMLESLGYKYDLAKNGEEAIVLYKRYLNIGRPYDAVIMDLTVVGGMGGEECFQELRKLDPNVRAIVASGYDSDDMAREFLDKGFCGYLSKPYRVYELGKRLKAARG